MDNYPKGSTNEEWETPSDIPFPNLDPGSPDARGFNPHDVAEFRTGIGVVRGGKLMSRGDGGVQETTG